MMHAMVVGVAVLGLVAGSPALASEALARDKGCLACHKATGKADGPSIKDIAAKYKGRTDGVDSMAANIKAGKGHPPSTASETDLRAIVAWMLK